MNETCDAAAPGVRREESFDPKTGIKTVIDYKEDVITENDKSYTVQLKVTSTFERKTKRVPRIVAQRKHWVKFGGCANDKPGVNPANCYVDADIPTQWIRTATGEVMVFSRKVVG